MSIAQVVSIILIISFVHEYMYINLVKLIVVLSVFLIHKK